MRTVIPFKPDFKIGGVRIIAISREATKSAELTYLCTLDCCGREAEFTHLQLIHRRAKGVRYCRPCGFDALKKKKTGRHKYQIDPSVQLSGERGRRGKSVSDAGHTQPTGA